MNNLKINELGYKADAELFLMNCCFSKKLEFPDEEIWLGINLLERDDELPTFPKPKEKKDDTGSR